MIFVHNKEKDRLGNIGQMKKGSNQGEKLVLGMDTWLGCLPCGLVPLTFGYSAKAVFAGVKR